MIDRVHFLHQVKPVGVGMWGDVKNLESPVIEVIGKIGDDLFIWRCKIKRRDIFLGLVEESLTTFRDEKCAISFSEDRPRFAKHEANTKRCRRVELT